MDCADFVKTIKAAFTGFNPVSTRQNYPDEAYIKVKKEDFKQVCLILHKMLSSPVLMLFAEDSREKDAKFVIYAVFLSLRSAQWIVVTMDIPGEEPEFDSLSRQMHSASLFEREVKEMFGIYPQGNPDLRSLNLHEEVFPKGNFPLRKDFQEIKKGDLSDFQFTRVEGEGIFEVPVGPVHAGIIGPGHFRFSSAGEPIVNLEIRLGFTHRGVEKIFEGKDIFKAIGLAECISGDSCFAHSLAFATAAERISGLTVSRQAALLRAIFLELERMYNHINGISGIALDVGFSFPAAYASIIKESILQLNECVGQNRYLKNINTIGGVLISMDDNKKALLLDALKKVENDFHELVKILDSSASFMDRVDGTGVLKRKTAEDLGIVGMAARACGIGLDLRKYFPGVYQEAGFKIILQESGDVLARLRLRQFEFMESLRLIRECAAKLETGGNNYSKPGLESGFGLGFAEGWRGHILYWLKIDGKGLIQRCKVVDASFCNWRGLAYAVLGNIIADFPVCNKSFDLSYAANDL